MLKSATHLADQFGAGNAVPVAELLELLELDLLRENP
jgi:hypothetical protein